MTVAVEVQVENMVSQCAPWEPNDEIHIEQHGYLCSLLSSRLQDGGESNGDEDEDIDELFEIVNQFFEDEEASKKLVDLWTTAVADKKQKKNGNNPITTTTTNKASTLGGEEAENNTETTTTSEREEEEEEEKVRKNTKSRSPNRERKNRKKKSRSPRRERKNNKTTKSHSCSPAAANNSSDDDEEKSKNIHDVVARMKIAADEELDEMDDFASAWTESKDTGRVWGGRGYGGRGVNRGLGVSNEKDVAVNGLTLSFGGRDLLTDPLLWETHLVIANGHRYGLWGKNGVGKSTLLRRIANGSVPGFPRHLSVAMVHQEVLGTDRSVRRCMLDLAKAGRGGNNGARASAKREALEEELAELENMLSAEFRVDSGDNSHDGSALEDATNRMAEIYDLLEELDSREKNDSSDDECSNTIDDPFAGLEDGAVIILRGLQFTGPMLDIPVSELSGGWRMRVALAEALYSEPDVLLLDEPTNHLDASATIFLEGYLLENELTLVVVSHDGNFLDAVCTDMIKFENAKLTYHVGNYSTFRDREEQLWKSNTRIAEATAKKEKKTMEFIQKQKSMSKSKHRDDNKQRQAKEREKKLSRIGLYNTSGKRFKLLSERKGVNCASHINGTYTNAAGFSSGRVANSQKAFGEERRRLLFKFPSAAPLKGATGDFAPLITMEDCRFRYDDDAPSWLLKDMTLNVSVGSRIAVIGKNGAGKSTLVKLLCGELSVKGGAFHAHQNLKIAHIAQHHIEHLGAHLERTPVEYFMIRHGAKSEHEARQFLGGFGLVGPLALQLIGTLSGGQKARLAFATVMYNAPHVLILDEPTNHLDTDSLESLSSAVNKFEGAVVMVSHNQQFMSQCANEMWTVANGKVTAEAVDGNEPGSSFDDLYGKYKEKLRKEVQLRGKKTKKRSKK